MKKKQRPSVRVLRKIECRIPLHMSWRALVRIFFIEKTWGTDLYLVLFRCRPAPRMYTVRTRGFVDCFFFAAPFPQRPSLYSQRKPPGDRRGKGLEPAAARPASCHDYHLRRVHPATSSSSRWRHQPIIERAIHRRVRRVSNGLQQAFRPYRRGCFLPYRTHQPIIVHPSTTRHSS